MAEKSFFSHVKLSECTLHDAGTSSGGRCRNFTEKEKSMLVDLVGQHVSVIECKKIDAKSLFEKKQKWQKIQEEFNALSDTYRTTAQLRTMWKNAKARFKKLNVTMEENFREAVCVGKVEAVKHFLSCGVNVNSQNSINGWTALHWAAKRKQKNILDLLLAAGADKSIKNNKGETAVDICPSLFNDKAITDEKLPSKESDASFVPNYMKNPVFPYVDVYHKPNSKHKFEDREQAVCAKSKPQICEEIQSEWIFAFQPESLMLIDKSTFSPCGLCVEPSRLVVKVRPKEKGVLVENKATPEEADFIEVSFDRSQVPTYASFVSTLEKELQLTSPVLSVRKLPNTIIRSQADIRRLTDYQMIEVIHSSTTL